ncbi:MAG: hypothetical protein PHD76_12750 [Methylacidiphilales bacterium]|nr:hypothetical protein [Candidatus Methylacidiphilales bacterium]
MNDINERDFTGICIYCGKALFTSQRALSSSGRLICSDACGKKLLADEIALDIIRAKTIRQMQLSSISLYIIGIIFLLFGIPHLFMKHFLFLGVFVAGMGIVFIFCGFLYSRKNEAKQKIT